MVGLFHIYLHIHLHLNCGHKCTDIYNGIGLVAIKGVVVVEKEVPSISISFQIVFPNPQKFMAL